MAKHKTSPSNHVIKVVLGTIIQVMFIKMVLANESKLLFSSQEIDQTILNLSTLTGISQGKDEIFNLNSASNVTRNNFQNKTLQSSSKRRGDCDYSSKAETAEIVIEEPIEINATQNINKQTEAALNNLLILQEQVKDQENNLDEMEKYLTVLMNQKDDQYDQVFGGKDLKSYQSQAEVKNKKQKINISIKIPKNKNSALKIVMMNLKELQRRLKQQQTFLNEMRKQTKLLLKQEKEFENKLKLNECERKLQTASETIQLLVSNTATAKKNNKDLEKQLNQCQNESKEKTNLLQTASKYIQDLQSQSEGESKNKNKELQMANKNIQDVQNQLNQCQHESQKKIEELQVAAMNIHDLQNQLNQSENKCKQETEELHTVSKNNQDLEEQLNQCQNESKAQTYQLQTASKNNQDLQSQLKQSEDESENKNQELQLANNNVKEVLNQLIQCQNESQNYIQYLQNQSNQCQTDLKKNFEQLQAALMNIPDLQNQLKQLENKSRYETEELHTATKNNQDLEKQLNQCQNESKEQINQLQTASKYFEYFQNQCQNDSQKNSELLQTAAMNIQNLQNQLKQMQDKFQNVSKQIPGDSYKERLQAIIKRICVLEIFFGGTTALGYFYELKSVPISIIINDACNVPSDDELAKTKYILKFINQLSNISDVILAYETLYTDIKEKPTKINNTCLNFLKILIFQDGIQNSMAKTILTEIYTKIDDNFVENMKDLWVNIILGKDNKCEVTKIDNFFEVYSNYFGDNLLEILQRVFNEGYTLPDKYDTIMEFTKKIPSMSIKSQVYNILYNQLNSNYLINNYPRITKFAYYIMISMKEKKYPILLGIKNHLASWIQDLIWNGKKCTLKNRKYPGYLFSDGKSKIYSERERSDTQYSKYTPTNEVYWKFETSDYGETFTIRNILTDEYLYAEINSKYNVTGHKVLSNKSLRNIKGRSLWKVLPTFDPKFITIKNVFFDEYLHTKNGNRNRDKFSNYSVYLWRPNKSHDQKVEWELIC